MQNAKTIEREDALQQAEQEIETDTDEKSEKDGGIGLYLKTYDVSVVPNDFNISSLCSYMEAGTLRVPAFQRVYVWDKKQASRFIESLLLGLPVPQIFLFESGRNDLWIIDGQQRMMSIYFFSKGRFPRPGTMVLRHDMAVGKKLQDLPLDNDKLFVDFQLELKPESDGNRSPLHGKDIKQIDEEKDFLFSLLVLRSMTVRQHKPEGNREVAYEVFHRLNTGGKNLTPQQIRNCVYESKFLDMVRDLNRDQRWRKVIGHPNPVATQRDEEMVVRSFSMLLDGNNYSSPLARFINRFAEKMQKESDDRIYFLRDLFKHFLDACDRAPDVFKLEKSGFRYLLFEAVFVSLFSNCVREQKIPTHTTLPVGKIRSLLGDKQFVDTLYSGSALKAQVDARLAVAREHISI